MHIQPVSNEYKAVTYMNQHFSKTEDQWWQAMSQAVMKPSENTIRYHDTMKIIAKAYLNNQESSVQEALYHILPELKLKRIFLAVNFVTTNLPEAFKVLLSEKEFSKLPDSSLNIFKKSNQYPLYGKSKCNIQWLF